MSQLTFDRATAERLEQAYAARDIVRRRELVYARLQPRTGARILDVGCGPGFYVSELLDRVGPAGAVTGVDRSPEMLALARERSRAAPNAVFLAGDATALPVEDEEFDAALAIQVLEYVPEVESALGELFRVLKPGGRLVIWDIDWTTVSWHSTDPERMRRVLNVWDGHLAHRGLPRTLATRLRSAGFGDIAIDGHAFVASRLSADAYVGATFPIIEEYVRGTGRIANDELEAWATEQRRLSEHGAFYFACVQCCLSARKRP